MIKRWDNDNDYVLIHIIWNCAFAHLIVEMCGYWKTFCNNDISFLPVFVIVVVVIQYKTLCQTNIGIAVKDFISSQLFFLIFCVYKLESRNVGFYLK